MKTMCLCFLLAALFLVAPSAGAACFGSDARALINCMALEDLGRKQERQVEKLQRLQRKQRTEWNGSKQRRALRELRRLQKRSRNERAYQNMLDFLN